MADASAAKPVRGKPARARTVKARPAEGGRTPYAAVIYFHGIGEQRRFEETGRLIDKIDAFLGAQRARGAKLGKLVGIEAAIEPFRSDPARSISYVESRYLPDADEDAKAKTVRYYEVYWAPVMAGEKSPWRVLRWMGLQQRRPFRTLGSPWRERQRLRRAALVSLFERGAKLPDGVQPDDLPRMISHYTEFEGLPAQRAYPKGDFKAFMEFVREREAGEPDALARQEILADRWKRFYQGEEWRNAFALTTLAMTLLLLAGVTTGAILLLLQQVQGTGIGKTLLQSLNLAAPTIGSAFSLAASLFLLLGLGKFLTGYLGDVEAWATYTETDEKNERRSRVLDRSREMIEHVLADPRCDRVCIVSHSLGASIAHDALLNVARRNRAESPGNPDKGPVDMGKIEHFVTMGSPIDKIEYFFESYRSTSHRFKRVVEELRGDIGTYPFCMNRHPHIHWVNFWDEGDPISGALQSPASATRTSQQVDNVHAPAFRFPAPGASHSGYFDNGTVISSLFQMVYLRAFSFAALPSRVGKPKDYESVLLGPGEPTGAARGFVLLAAATPWLALIGFALWGVSTKWPLPQAVVIGPFALSGLAAVSLWISHRSSKRKGHRFPF